MKIRRERARFLPYRGYVTEFSQGGLPGLEGVFDGLGKGGSRNTDRLRQRRVAKGAGRLMKPHFEEIQQRACELWRVGQLIPATAAPRSPCG
jgi:hypothetical protein